MSFLRYQHVERFGTAEVEGIEVGTCYVFPKLDGTNASVWIDEDKPVGHTLCCGSRNRELELDNDNAGFMNAMYQDKAIMSFMYNAKDLVLYGEWLVPHSLKTYRDDAWRKFYVFDVYDKTKERLLRYEEYASGLDAAGINYLAPINIIKNGNIDYFTECLNKNVFLIKDGEGVGEGIVIKNYDYQNKYGRQTWAKMVTNEFKEKHHKEMGAPLIGCEIVEEKIVSKIVTQAIVDKVVAKIVLTNDGWHSKCIPQLINTVFYDLVKEESWEFVKAHKNPTINYKTLSHYCTAKVKELRQDLF
jgi:hypothetical protein